MILINLLPPELRRSRSSGINPVVLAAAAGIVIVLAAAATWAWIEFSRIRAAEELLAKREQELVVATAAADKVKAIDQQISQFEKLHQTITSLITRKVFWARTLDDFASLLAQHGDNRWTREGYEVRCTGLTIAPAARRRCDPRRQGGRRLGGVHLPRHLQDRRRAARPGWRLRAIILQDG